MVVASIYAGVVATTDVEEATRDVEIAIMVGGFPRKAGMERKDVMSKNVSIYKSQASALEKNAKPGVKVCTSSRRHALHPGKTCAFFSRGTTMGISRCRCA